MHKLVSRLMGPLVALLLLVPSARAQVTTEQFEGRRVVGGEVLIRVRAESGILPQIANDLDLEPVKRLGRGDVLLLRSKTRPVSDLVREWRGHPAVVWAEPNYILHAFDTPNDPDFGLQWGLQNTGQVILGVAGTPGADIDAPAAWTVTTGSRANVVGVIDSGTDYTHPDLAANMWSAPDAFTVTIGGQVITCPAGSHGFNAINRTCNPMDDNGHGTHVAGTIGAVGNNGIGVSGVNWTASMIGLKFLGASGSGSTANAIDAIQFAIQVKERFGADANIRVLNASWGGGGYSQALLDAINAANDSGMLFVVAAGNENRNNDIIPAYPANYNASNIISVASTTSRDLRSGFSNYGATTVDLGAPGSSILSTLPGGLYGYASGTSMATPHVAGAAALVLAACDLTTSALKSNLLTYADPVSALAGITVTGARLDVNSSIQACATPQEPGFTLSATPPGRSISVGDTTTYTLSIAPVGGFANPVQLEVAGLPVGATATLDPPTITGGSGSSTLTVETTGGVAPGTYTLTVTATSGALVRTAGPTLTVLPPLDFGVSAMPPTRTIAPGAGTVFQVALTRDPGFTAPVSFDLSGLPAEATGTFSAQEIVNSVVLLHIATTGAVAAGTYPLTITATGGGLVRTTTVSLRITGATANFTLSMSPAVQTVAPGEATTYSVTVSRSGGFTGDVGFDVSGLPAGATPVFTPPTTSGSDSTLTITTTTAVAAGTYPMTVTGTGGGLVRTTSATLIVSAPDYSLGATPALQTIGPGDSTTYDVTVTRIDGFAAPVTFSVSGLPTGATASFVPSTTTGSSSVLTITTQADVAPGTYALAITGTSGSLSRTTSATLVIGSSGGFTLSVTPATRRIARGGGTTFLLTIARSGGFTGPVAFSVTGLPASGVVLATFITLPTTDWTVLRIVTDASVPPGTYPLVIEGTSGSLTQSVSPSLVINP